MLHPSIKAWREQKPVVGTKNARGIDTVKNRVDATAASKTGNTVVESRVARAGDVDPKARL